MSDDHSRDRSKATQAGPLAGAGKPARRGPAARTMQGLPVMDPAQAQRIARAGISGRPPVTSPAAPPSSAPAPAATEHEKDRDSDTRYMEPPSEALGRAQTEAVLQVPQPVVRAPSASPPVPPAPLSPSAAERGPGLLGSTLHRAGRTHEPPVQAHAPAGPGLFSTSLSNMHDHEAPKPNAPRGPLTNNQAPEAWRDDVRRVAERSPAPPRPKVQPGPTASLRLKLDGDAYEEQPYRAPKSALPSVLLWLLVLGLAGGAAAYYVQGHGGVNAVIGRLRGLMQGTPTSAPAAAPAAEATQPTAPAAPPTAADQAQPPAAAAQPQQPAAAAAPPAEQPAQPPAAAAAPVAPPTAAGAEEARQLAHPDPPAAEAPTAPAKAPATAAPAKKAESKPRPEPKPKAPLRRQAPIVKVRPLDNTSTPPGNLDTPPTPPDMPYVPVPADPPAPDEPR